MKMPFVIGALVSITSPAMAHATTVDFEAQGANAPAFISPNTPPQTLVIGGATFAGGQLVKTTDDFIDPAVGDLTAAYTTFDYITTLHTLNPLTISFALPVSAVSFELVNNIAGDYQIITNLGTQTFTLGDNANQLIALSGVITSVAIKYLSSPTVGPFYDFAVDNVSFEPAAAVPELQAWIMTIMGLGMTGAVLRRRRVAARFGVPIASTAFRTRERPVLSVGTI